MIKANSLYSKKQPQVHIFLFIQSTTSKSSLTCGQRNMKSFEYFAIDLLTPKKNLLRECLIKNKYPHLIIKCGYLHSVQMTNYFCFISPP